MSIPFGQLQHPGFIPLYKSDEGPSMCELSYFLKQLYNYEPSLIHIIKQFIFTKSSPLNKEYISIWEIYAFYFNYRLSEQEYLELCNNNTFNRFWKHYNIIRVIDRFNSNRIIRSWQIKYKDILLVYDYCKKYYLNNHIRNINNYKTLIQLIILENNTKKKIILQKHIIGQQELETKLKNKLITKDECDKQLRILDIKNSLSKSLHEYQKKSTEKCVKIRNKILSIKETYDKLDSHLLCLK